MTTASSDELNQTGRVLLGMIAEGHSTGYAIKAEIERSTRNFWGASVGGIYPELRRLAKAGLVSVRDDPRGGARRHAYSLTDAGAGALSDWLSDPSEPARETRDEGLLRLRFAGVLDRDQRVALADRVRARHERHGHELDARLEAGEFDDPYHRMTLEFARDFDRWASDWWAAAETGLAGAS